MIDVCQNVQLHYKTIYLSIYKSFTIAQHKILQMKIKTFFLPWPESTVVSGLYYALVIVCCRFICFVFMLNML